MEIKSHYVVLIEFVLNLCLVVFLSLVCLASVVVYPYMYYARAVLLSDVAACICSLCGLCFRTACLGAVHVQASDINTAMQLRISESAIYR